MNSTEWPASVHVAMNQSDMENYTSSRPPLPAQTSTAFPNTNVFLPHPALVQPMANWSEAQKIYGWAWDLHVYALGALFAVMAFYSLICIIQLFRLSTTRSVRCYYVVLHTILVVFGISRAVFLLVDPYHSKRILPQAVAAAFLHLSFPCVTSTFSMVLAGLIRTARLKLLKSRIMNMYLLSGIIVGNFVFAVGAEVAVVLTGVDVFSVASQTYFIAWCVGLGLGYFVMYNSLLLAAHDADGLELGLTRRVSVGVTITLLSAVLLLMFAALHVYGLIAVYGFLKWNGDDDYDVWRWYGFHMGTRVTELFLCGLLAFVASLTMWTRAARRTSVQVKSPDVTEEAEKRQKLLMHGRLPPASPARNRRDFPVTFNPDGVKTDDEFFPAGRFPNRQRKPVSQLLEGNPLHNVDEDRYG